MNDELVHTGFDKLGWFFFLICIYKNTLNPI